MNIDTQSPAQASMTANEIARAIDAEAEWREARWWADCPWHADGGEKHVTIWQGFDGPVIRCGCGCSTDKLRAWLVEMNEKCT